jgi:hypothetical protein
VPGCSPADMQSATLRTASRRLSSIASTLQQASSAPATRRMPKTKVAIVGVCPARRHLWTACLLTDCPMHLLVVHCRLWVRNNRRATAGGTAHSISDTHCPTSLLTATGAVPLPRFAVRSASNCGYDVRLSGTVVPGERGTYAAAPSRLALNCLVRVCLLRQECIKIP